MLLFDGESVVEEDSLQDAVARYHYKADFSELHEIERDALKYWNNSGIHIAFLGIENQLCKALHNSFSPSSHPFFMDNAILSSIRP